MATEEIESILTSTKKSLGILEDYDFYDPELIMHINSVFSTLEQLGVGPVGGFAIDGKDEKWDAFLSPTDKTLRSVRTYIYLKVRLVFDPPATSFAIDAFEKQAKEFEWRFTVNHDVKTVTTQNTVQTTP